MELKVKLLTDTAKLPTKAHDSDAGWDIYADEDCIIYPGETVKVKTGISVQLDGVFNTSHETIAHLIWDRSSLGSKGIHRLAGCVDFGFSGEILVCLTNLNVFSVISELRFLNKDSDFYTEITEALNKNAYKINRGDKIAQILTQRVSKVVISEGELKETDRGSKGFGSSDAKVQSTL
ncbi:MAG: hypothetical protein KBD25_03985 [Rickettsiaceae bacterium]|nr:hypothetical protein [Rickettsiaceae bacterium]